MAKAKTPLIRVTLLRRDWVNRVSNLRGAMPIKMLQHFLSEYAQTKIPYGPNELDGFDQLLKMYGKPTIPTNKA